LIAAEGRMTKKFKLSKEQIKRLVPGSGGCIASDRITVDGCPVGLMYREAPSNDIDTGWVFLAGDESDDYMENSDNHAIYAVNTFANYDPSIIPLLASPIGSAFERLEAGGDFIVIADWTTDEE
jgi:hypothetical protein